MKQKVGILSLGCPRNLVDSEALLGRLNLKGYPITDITKADIGIINTCAFIEDAKKESIEAILDLVALKKEGRLKKIIVCGCLPQRYKKELCKGFPEVDCFLGTPSLNHTLARFGLTPKHFAYLKISEGCIQNCSFCAIPKIKGKFSSLDVELALKKAKLLEEEGVRELNLVGQDISGYGLDLYGKRTLPELVASVLREAKNIRWLRLLYLYPDKIIEPLLALMKADERICKYIDLPIQHINNRILKLMRRKTTKKEIISLMEKIRKQLPGAAIRTSLVVGFPSETEKEFSELLDFIKEAKFERLGAFIYSPEEGTPAAKLAKQIPQKVRLSRFDAVMSLQQEISRSVNRKWLGKTLEVLIDEQEKDVYLGRTRFDAPEVDGLVYVRPNRPLRPGDFIQAKITDTLEYDLVGEAL